jgi:hypothetical protein
LKCVSPSTDLVTQQLPFTPSEVGSAVNVNPFQCNVGNSKWVFTLGSYEALSRPSDCKSFCGPLVDGVVVVVAVVVVGLPRATGDAFCTDAVVVVGLPRAAGGACVGAVAAAALVSGSMDCSIAALRCTPPDPDADTDAGPDGWGVLLVMVLVPGEG